jgi:hypothetical protein
MPLNGGLSERARVVRLLQVGFLIGLVWHPAAELHGAAARVTHHLSCATRSRCILDQGIGVRIQGWG